MIYESVAVVPYIRLEYAGFFSVFSSTTVLPYYRSITSLIYPKTQDSKLSTQTGIEICIIRGEWWRRLLLDCLSLNNLTSLCTSCVYCVHLVFQLTGTFTLAQDQHRRGRCGKRRTARRTVKEHTSVSEDG